MTVVINNQMAYLYFKIPHAADKDNEVVVLVRCLSFVCFFKKKKTVQFVHAFV